MAFPLDVDFTLADRLQTSPFAFLNQRDEPFNLLNEAFVSCSSFEFHRSVGCCQGYIYLTSGVTYYRVLKPRSRIELALEHLGFSSIALCDFPVPIT